MVYGDDVGVSPGTSITGRVVLDSSVFAASLLTAHDEVILAGTAITFGKKSELHGCTLAQSAVTFESVGYIEPNHYIGNDNVIASPSN
jgi:carbonic anhydrase/acetyltransferase-like protein (isoleucine patch superfamily)